MECPDCHSTAIYSNNFYNRIINRSTVEFQCNRCGRASSGESVTEACRLFLGVYAVDKDATVVRKLTDFKLIGELIEECTDTEISKYSEFEAYRNEHSLIRTQLYLIKVTVPSFVSVHLVRHSQTGQFHFVKSNRTDRGGTGTEDRNTPVRHTMILNAKHLVDMSRYRLCAKASHETREVWEIIKAHIAKIDKEISDRMVPNCEYRGGICPEAKSCGYNIVVAKKMWSHLFNDKGKE